MSEAEIIDGKAFSQGLRKRIFQVVQDLKKYEGFTPSLAVVTVGNDPASKIYVRNKAKRAEDCGIRLMEYYRDGDISEQELLTLVLSLNENPEVSGVLVQLPLPDHIDADRIIGAIAPQKDVDGFHITNTGLLSRGCENALIPCTPLGCMMLIKDRFKEEGLAGKRAVVVGRSNLVGKPMASLLLNEDCTVTTLHSKTKDIEEECRRADIVVVAIGEPKVVKASWIKPGAVVLDVGINRIDQGEGKTKLIGDVDFDDVKTVAGALSPVPGGVGPMTVVSLMANTVTAACRQHRLDDPDFD